MNSPIRFSPFQLLLLILIVFVFWRQPILNFLGVSRHFLSGVHSVVVMLGGMYCFFSRVKNEPQIVRNDLVLVGVFLGQLSCFIYLYSVDLSQFVYGYVYYGFIPLYAYFPYTALYKDYSSFLIRIITILYVCTFVISVLQFLEIDAGSLFATDESVITKYTFFGTVRVNGLVGNFVNYACLSYLFFLYFLTRHVESPQKYNVFFILISLSAILMTFTRAYIFLSALVLVFIVIRYMKLSIVLWLLGAFALMSVYLNDLLEPLVGVILSEDRHTQVSNQVRIDQFRQMIDWLDEYLFYGEGSGFLLGPNSFKKQWVTDGLFFMFLIELGLVVSFIYIVSFLVLVCSILRLNIFSSRIKGYRLNAYFVVLGYLAVAFINSAHAEFVTSIITYLVIGGALYRRSLEEVK